MSFRFVFDNNKIILKQNKQKKETAATKKNGG